MSKLIVSRTALFCSISRSQPFKKPAYQFGDSLIALEELYQIISEMLAACDLSDTKAPK
jgi:hypothetical protein